METTDLRIPERGEIWVHPKSGKAVEVISFNRDKYADYVVYKMGDGLAAVPLSTWREFTPCLPIEGKTIAKVTKMKKPDYDDEGWLRLEFTDGTFCVIESGYGFNTGCSEGEYPTDIRVSSNDVGLVPIEEGY